jgi:hypothetical protein
VSDWNEELVRFKEQRRLPADLHRPVMGRARKFAKPWLVMSTFLRQPYVAHRARTREEAEKWIEKQCRSYAVQRWWPPIYVEQARARAAAQRSRYSIEERK